MNAYLDQDIQSHRLWNESPFSSAQALLDIVLMACEKNTEILFRGSYYQIKIGQTITSDKILMSRWSWSRNKVRSFLLQLEYESIIFLDRNKRRSIITIENTAICGIITTTEGTTKKPEKISIKEQVIKQEKGYLNTTATEGLNSVEVQVKEQEKGHQKGLAKSNEKGSKNLFTGSPDEKLVGNPDPNSAFQEQSTIEKHIEGPSNARLVSDTALQLNYKLKFQ